MSNAKYLLIWGSRGPWRGRKGGRKEAGVVEYLRGVSAVPTSQKNCYAPSSSRLDRFPVRAAGLGSRLRLAFDPVLLAGSGSICGCTGLEARCDDLRATRRGDGRRELPAWEVDPAREVRPTLEGVDSREEGGMGGGSASSTAARVWSAFRSPAQRDTRGAKRSSFLRALAHSCEKKVLKYFFFRDMPAA